MGLLGCCLLLVAVCSVNCQFFKTDIPTRLILRDDVNDDILTKIFMDVLTKRLLTRIDVDDVDNDLLRKKFIMSKVDRVTRKDWLNDMDTLRIGNDVDVVDKKKLIMMRHLLTKGLNDDFVTDMDVFHLMNRFDTNTVDDKTIMIIKLMLKKITDMVKFDVCDDILTLSMCDLRDDVIDNKKMVFIKRLLNDLYTHDIMDTDVFKTKDWGKRKVFDKFTMKNIRKIVDDDDVVHGLKF